ncbi:GNAT family N-acetyltransferase [Bacillus toyonensis]|uniref:GNAT family N-acetyltransferase n=1 Tax=Bacillus toyonensis TaxID=155322 RepID=UPI0021757FAF|nr:GNAT family protein [Bacillus toyonensis]
MENEENDYWIFPNVPNILIIFAADKLIGTVGCYWIDKNYWNGGYGTEAYKLWIDFLFRSTELHRVGMSTWSENIRMMRGAEKMGMKEEARMVGSRYFDGIKMEILRKEWEQV